MATITPITNGMAGLTARDQINQALQSVDVTSRMSGDGTSGSPLQVENLPWGNLTGSLSNQADLQLALNNKQAVINNIKVVNTLADFPTPVADVITVDSEAVYILGAQVDIGNSRFDGCSDTSFRGTPGSSGITSTTTGVLFGGNDVGILGIDGLDINCPNADLVNINDAVPGTSTVNLIDTRILALNSLGSVEDILGFAVSNSAAFSLNSGLTIVGNNNQIISADRFLMISTNPSFVGYNFGTSVVPTVDIKTVVFDAPSGAVGVSGTANSGNIPVGSVGVVEACTFLGGITPLVNIADTDFRWSFSNNSGIPDTRPDGLLDFTGNTSETIITAANAPVQINAVWDIDRLSHFTANVDGSITYIGERPLTIPIDLDVGLTGTNSEGYVTLAIDGSDIVTGIPIQISNSQARIARVMWQHTFSTGQVLTARVANSENTNNITVSNGIFRLN